MFGMSDSVSSQTIVTNGPRSKDAAPEILSHGGSELSPHSTETKQFGDFVKSRRWIRQLYLVLLISLFTISGLFSSSTLFAQRNTVTLVNCTIYTMTNRGVIENGTLRISGGKVDQIGVQIPVSDSNETVIDLNGGYVLPGLIDPHSIYNIDGPGDYDKRPLSVAQNFELTDEAIHTALANGITTVALRPPSDSLVSGYSTLVHLLPDSLGGPIVEQDTLDLQVSIEGMEYPISLRARQDSERMKRIYRFRDIVRDLGETHPNSSQRNRTGFALEQAVNHRVPLYILVDDAMGFLQARQVIQSLDTPVYFGRMHQIVEVIRESGRSIRSGGFRDFIVGPTLFSVDPETNRYYSIPSRLSEIGLRYAVGSFHEFPPKESLLDQVRKLNMYGITEIEALGAFTVIPGRTLQPRSNLGTITTGALANIVVLNKPPMDVRGEVVLTLVNGYPVWR